MSNKPHLRPHQGKRQATQVTRLLMVVLIIALFALAIALEATGHVVFRGRLGLLSPGLVEPETADHQAKGIAMLTDDGLLEKRRGIGMFVAAGARARLLGERRKRFAERYVEPLVAEAGRLGIDADELVTLIREASYPQGGATP